MPALKVRCRDPKCARMLRIPADVNKPQFKARCPHCGSVMEIRLPPTPAIALVEDDPIRPTADDDDGGTYGVARETSLSYLLQREQTGHRLSPEEKATKKRLVAEALAANPRQCPACQERLGALRRLGGWYRVIIGRSRRL